MPCSLIDNRPYTWILALTLIDVICTTFGINNGFIGEANPLLQRLFDYPVIACIVIMAVTALMLMILRECQKRVAWICGILWVIVAVKVAVVVVHVVWMMEVV